MGGCRLTVTIYGDVLAAINFIVTLAILRLCGRILGVSPGRIARYWASALAAAAAFIIFVPISSIVLQLLYRLTVSCLVIGVAFPRGDIRLFLKATGVFYAVSFLMAGAVAGLLWAFPTSGFYTKNGSLYYNLNPLVLLGAIAAAYGAVTLFDRFNARRVAGSEIYRLTVRRQGREVKLLALADSGNRLTEPFSGLPVVVTSASSVWKLLDDEEKKQVVSRTPSESLPGVRWLLCRSATHPAMLPAIRPDDITVEYEGKQFSVGAYLALAREPIGEEGSYSAVFNPRMIQVLL